MMVESRFLGTTLIFFLSPPGQRHQ
jgi:hypothetical protein